MKKDDINRIFANLPLVLSGCTVEIDGGYGVKVTIGEETPEDYCAIREMVAAAFARSDEANLIDALRRSGDTLLSLVAAADGHLAGHILFTRMWIERVPAVALAPLAVLPEDQRRGIGSQLICEGIERLRDMGDRIVVVLGDPDYYPRFGFSARSARGFEHPFPPEAYMALELVPGALDDVRGKVRYPAAFGIG